LDVRSTVGPDESDDQRVKVEVLFKKISLELGPIRKLLKREVSMKR